MSIKIDWHPEAFIEEMNVKVDVGLNNIGEMVKDEAKATCPVKTGALKASIRKDLKLEEKAVYVGSDLYYSTTVELGTSKRIANPFLRRALDKVESFLASAFS